MDFEDFVAHLAARASVHDAQAVLRASAGRGASHYVADAAELSIRQAQRWLSDQFPASRSEAIKGLVSDKQLAAQVLRHATQVTFGQRVSVYYKNKPAKNEGTRPIRNFSVSSNVAAFLGAAADALDADDLEAAEPAGSDGIICGYEDGLEDTLGVADYSGIDITT